MITPLTPSCRLVTTAILLPAQIMDWLAYQADSMQGKHLLSLSQEMIAAEVNNVVDELHRGQGLDQVGRKVLSCIARHCLLQGNTVPTIGREHSIRGISTTPEGIRKLQRMMLGVQNNTLMVCGHVPERDLIKEVDRLFGGMKRNDQARGIPMAVPPTGRGCTTIDIRENAGATLLTFGWPLIAYCSDTWTLKTIAEIFAAPPGCRSLTQPLQESGLFFQCSMEVPLHATPDYMYAMCSIPTSKAEEAGRMETAVQQLKHIFGTILPGFTDQSALEAARKRLKRGYQKLTGGQASGVADALTEGIKCGDITALWQCDEYLDAITVEDIQRVAAKYLTEHNVVMVKYWQTELSDVEGDFRLVREVFPTQRTPRRPVCYQHSGKGLSPTDLAYASGGATCTRTLSPASESLVALVFDDAGRKSSWGDAKVLTHILCKFFVNNAELANMGTELKWDVGYRDIVCLIEGASATIQRAVDLVLQGLSRQTITSEFLDKAKKMLSALAPGQRYDAAKLCKMQFFNATYPEESACHIEGADEQLERIGRVSLRSINRFLARLTGVPRAATVNATQLHIATGAATTGASADVPVSRYRPIATLDQLERTPSANVTIAMPISNVTSDDAKTMGALKLGVEVIGNGFAGRLMNEVRDVQGLTYSIAPRLYTTHVTPALVVTATFNKDVIAHGISYSKSLLGNWIKHGISRDELVTARSSMLAREALTCTSHIGAMRKMLRQMREPHAPDEQQYWNAIRTATLQQVNGVLAGLNADGFSVSVAGTVTVDDL